MAAISPHNLAAEQAVLGSIMIDPDAISDLSGTLTADDFYREAHAGIYQAALDLNSQAIAIDYLTISRQLAETGILEAVGGNAYLAQLINAVPTAAHARYYGKIVADLASKRRAINFGGDLAGAGYRDEKLDLGIWNERWLELTRPHVDTVMEAITLQDFLAIDLSQQRPIIGQGLLPYGGRLVFAGAPKLGKSVLILQMALALAEGKNWLDLFPIEHPWRVLYLDFEWALQITQDRLRAMTQDALPPRGNFWVGSLPPMDILATGYTQMSLAVRRVAPDILIIDTFSKLHTAEENSSTAMNQVFNCLDRFRLEHKLAGLILVHHDRKAQLGTFRKSGDIQNIRGSSAILGWPESLAIVEDDPTGGRRISLGLRDQQSISQILTEYDAETMLSTAQTVTDRDITIPADMIKALIEKAGGRLLRQKLVDEMALSGMPERTSGRALKYLKDKGTVEAVTTTDPEAHPNARDYILKVGE